jgi:hypothetical protein
MDKIWSLFSGKSNILKFLLSAVRFTKRLGVRVPLRPPRKKALGLLNLLNELALVTTQNLNVYYHNMSAAYSIYVLFVSSRKIDLLQNYKSNVLGSGAFVFSRCHPKGW